MDFLQGLEGGWAKHYNFRCQPVDYTYDPVAMRVSLLKIKIYYYYNRLKSIQIYKLKTSCNMVVHGNQ